MKEPTGQFGGVEMDTTLFHAFRAMPQTALKEFLQRCKHFEYTKLDAAQTADDRLKVQVRAQFVGELNKFFETLLTKSE